MTDELSFSPAADPAELIRPAEERGVRLLVFGAALLAITMREKRDSWDDPDVTPPGYIAEARAVADTIVAEAKRLDAKRLCDENSTTDPDHSATAGTHQGCLCNGCRIYWAGFTAGGGMAP
jgi:hypothetical protein